MKGDNFVEMLVGEEKPSSDFLQKLTQFDVFSSEELIEKVDEGIQNRQGEIEFTFSIEERLIMYLILACRVTEGENLESLDKKIQNAIYWALSYLETPLLKILFCVYDYPSIAAGIWKRNTSPENTLWGRCYLLEFFISDIEKVPYFPKNLLADLEKVFQQIEEVLESSKADEDYSVAKNAYEKGKQRAKKLLASSPRPLPPQLPSLKEFLSKYA